MSFGLNFLSGKLFALIENLVRDVVGKRLFVTSAIRAKQPISPTPNVGGSPLRGDGPDQAVHGGPSWFRGVMHRDGGVINQPARGTLRPSLTSFRTASCLCFVISLGIRVNQPLIN